MSSKIRRFSLVVVTKDSPCGAPLNKGEKAIYLGRDADGNEMLESVAGDWKGYRWCVDRKEFRAVARGKRAVRR